MSEFTSSINELDQVYQQRQKLISYSTKLVKQYTEGLVDLNHLVEASQLLVTVTDIHTKKVTSFIEGVINKALAEMYKSGQYYIKVEKDTYRGSANIEVNLYDSLNVYAKDVPLNLNDQAGDGISRIIAFMFSLSLIELCGGRKFVAVDEVLTGFHSDSLQIVRNVIEIFSKGGFQFIASEYDINNMGVIYKSEKINGGTKMVKLGLAKDVNYERTLI